MNNTTTTQPLFFAWLYLAVIASSIIVYLGLCLYFSSQLQQPLIEEQRVLIRSVCYAVAIITFPITNLLRHIQLRLNQTMPLAKAELLITAKKRYLLTIIVSLSLIESIAVLGFVMFILGDALNTLIIFELLAALGLFLYRPKQEEYLSIISALQ